MAVLQNPIHLLSQIRKKFPEAEKEDWILRLDDTKRKPKRSCVVCVARRPSLSESCLPLDETKSSLISFTLNTSHRITDAHFRDSICGLNASDVIGRRIDQLCVRDDKSVLDTLLDSVAECSAELRLCIKENIISTRARTLKSANNNSDGSIVLECAVIRCLKHSLQKQYSAPDGCSSDNGGKLKLSSSSESLKCCDIQDSSLDKRRHSTPSGMPSPETPFDVPRCGIDAISPATATESSASVHFETLSPPSSVPTELKCSEQSSANSDALSQLCTTIFAEVPTAPTDSLCDYTNTAANSNNTINNNSNNNNTNNSVNNRTNNSISKNNSNNSNNNNSTNSNNNRSPLQPPCHQLSCSSSSSTTSQQLLIQPQPQPPPPQQQQQQQQHPQTQTPPFQFYSDQMFYVPCSSSLPPPQTAITTCAPVAPQPPPQYLPSAEVSPPVAPPPTVELTKNGKVKKPRRPRQPKANSRGRGGSQKRKNSAPEPASIISTVSNVPQWCSQMNTTLPSTAPPQTQNAMQQQCPTNGPPKVRDALLKSLLQSAHPSEQTPTRCSSSSSLCSPIPDPAPIMRSSSDNIQPSFAYPDHLSWSTNITDDSQNCPYPSSAAGGCGIVTGDCAPYEMIPSMIASSNSSMLQMNSGMQDAHQRSGMMQRQQHWPNTQQQQDFIYQQPSQTAVFQQPMVSSNTLPSSSMKTSSPLKRKPVSAMSQSQVNIPATNPSTTNELPPKFVHVNQQTSHQQQYPTLYQLSSSANSNNQSTSPQQYAQQQQQQSAVSPQQQYPTQSPNPVSRLSPYGGYDGSQNGTCSLNTNVGATGTMCPPPTQWTKRGTAQSGSEMIRMDIRHSAHPNYHSPMMSSSATPPQLQSTPPSTQLLQQPNSSLSNTVNTSNSTNNGNQQQQQQPIIVIHSQSMEQTPSQQLSNGYYVTSSQNSSPLTTNLSPQNYYSTGMPSAINDPMNTGVNAGAGTLTQQTSLIPTELYDFNLGNGGFDMDNDATRMLVQKLLS